jgi:hypothetical protein
MVAIDGYIVFLMSDSAPRRPWKVSLKKGSYANSRVLLKVSSLARVIVAPIVCSCLFSPRLVALKTMPMQDDRDASIRDALPTSPMFPFGVPMPDPLGGVHHPRLAKVLCLRWKKALYSTAIGVFVG